MRVCVHLFAIARERAGRSIVEVELTEPATVSDLKRAIAREVPAIAPLLGSIRFSVDAEYADDETPIPPSAELAAIPPVSGGTAADSN